jgi:glutamyl-tRNA reductase
MMSESPLGLSVIGLCHVQASLSLREQAAARLHRLFRNRPLEARSWPTVLLSTCNRCELYGPTESLHEWSSLLFKAFDDIEEKKPFYQKDSWDCFRHLCQVSCGLQSPFFAETQITHQVKIAYERASSAQELSASLHFAFQKALHMSKSVRHSLHLDGSHASLETTLWQLIEPSDRLLFVGASAMNEAMLHSFLTRGAKNITLANRSLSERAQKILSLPSVQGMKWEDLALWPEFDQVFIATTSLNHLAAFNDNVAYAFNRSEAACRNLFDLSVPCNASPLFASKGLRLWNIDDLKKRVEDKALLHITAKATALECIEEELKRHQRRWHLKKLFLIQQLAKEKQLDNQADGAKTFQLI